MKLLYDLHPKAKIFLSGSAPINMYKQARESLAGRFFDFIVKPLSFDEYIIFKNINIDVEREAIFEKDIKRLLADYFSTGGFVETMPFNQEMRVKYFKESLIERVVFLDIPGAFKLDAPELLYHLIKIIASRPGLYLDYKNLSNDLKYDQRTIMLYFSYLEYALFLQKLYNYSKNLLKSKKKLKRVYLANIAFTLVLEPKTSFSILLEQFFANMLEAKYFMKTPQKEEINIIYTQSGKVIPVEIKCKEKIHLSDAKILIKFMERNSLPSGLLISLDTETTFKKDKFSVDVTPYWKYWTIKNKIESAHPIASSYNL